MWGSYGVCESRCKAVVVYRNCGLYEFRCEGVAVGGVLLWGSLTEGKSRCGVVVVCGSCGAEKLHFRGVTLFGAHGSY